MKRILITILATFAFTNNVFADADSQRLHTTVDQITQQFMFAKNIPGVAIAIYDNGDNHIYTYGYEDVDKKIPINKDTIFELGSISKVFTSTLLATQVQEGKIKLNDPIVKFLPGLDQTKGLPIDDVTVENLATHTSSFPRDVQDFGIPKNDKAKLIAALKVWKPNDPIGTHYSYSNVGFGLLGEVTANAAQTDYINLLNKEIVKPLNLTHTMIFVPANLTQDQAQGYRRTGKPAPHFVTTYLYGGGSLRSSAADMLKFVKANLGVKDSAPPSLLSAMQMTHQPKFKVNRKMAMGLGWQQMNRRGEIFYTKNGINIGFNTFVLFSPARQIGIVVLIDRRDGGASILGRMIFSAMIQGMDDGMDDIDEEIIGPTDA